MTQPTTTVELGTPTATFLGSSPIKFQDDCLQEISTCWYKFSQSANSKTLPTIRVKTGTTIYSAPYVSGLSIYVPPAFNATIQNFTITLRGLPDNSDHSEQKDFIYGIIGELMKSGWQRYLHPSDPRISGLEGRKLENGETVLGSTVMSHPWFDPDEKMTLKQWHSIHSTYEWYFADKDDNHLLLKAWKWNSVENPKTRGTYLITLEFDSELSFWRKSFKQPDKKNWVALLPNTIRSFEKERAALETKAEAAGITINRDYRPPAIKALTFEKE